MPDLVLSRKGLQTNSCLRHVLPGAEALVPTPCQQSEKAPAPPGAARPLTDHTTWSGQLSFLCRLFKPNPGVTPGVPPTHLPDLQGCPARRLHCFPLHSSAHQHPGPRVLSPRAKAQPQVSSSSVMLESQSDVPL
ncbi:hypothetical protein HJG60_010862 [Phyllostomus discolor]|uniref:Uncharacterized protein n=1 Tax=Phyllostomus discolor TaxID=89673 RepID=A0A834EAA0_9CHIR|nr:hypothetical protein HJG60_010862 [Phyllostomus discolor]